MCARVCARACLLFDDPTDQGLSSSHHFCAVFRKLCVRACVRARSTHTGVAGGGCSVGSGPPSQRVCLCRCAVPVPMARCVLSAPPSRARTQCVPPCPLPGKRSSPRRQGSGARGLQQRSAAGHAGVFKPVHGPGSACCGLWAPVAVLWCCCVRSRGTTVRGVQIRWQRRDWA